jgi:hypothetical protein
MFKEEIKTNFEAFLHFLCFSLMKKLKINLFTRDFCGFSSNERPYFFTFCTKTKNFLENIFKSEIELKNFMWGIFGFFRIFDFE